MTPVERILVEFAKRVAHAIDNDPRLQQQFWQLVREFSPKEQKP